MMIFVFFWCLVICFGVVYGGRVVYEFRHRINWKEMMWISGTVSLSIMLFLGFVFIL